MIDDLKSDAIYEAKFCQVYLMTSNFSMELLYNNEHNTLRYYISITSVAKKDVH